MERSMLGAAFWVMVAVFAFVVPETANAIPANLKLPVVAGAFLLGLLFALTESREFSRFSGRGGGGGASSTPSDTCPGCGTVNYFKKYNPAWPKQCYKCGRQW